jgi:protein O-GlcNAc transferase
MTEAATRAIRLLVDKNLNDALAILSRPADAADHAVLGMIKLAQDDWAGARHALLQAREQGDHSSTTLLNLALAEDRLGLAGRARMEEIADQNPSWDEPPLRLAESFRRSGDRTAACVHYEHTLERNPNRSEALLGLAALKIMLGEASAAEPLLLRCCGVAPAAAEAWDALGVVLMLNGDPGLAESAFAEAQRLLPHSTTIALRRLDAAIAAGSEEAELARLEIGTERDPLNTAQLTARGVLLDRMGRPGDAADILEVASALAPDVTWTAAALANSLLHAGRFVSAVPALRHAIALSPQEPAQRNDLAAALNRVHRYREARGILEILIAEFGENPIYLCNLCNSLISLGLHTDGLAAARRATVVAPEQSLVWRTLANALVYAEGIASLELLAALGKASGGLARPSSTAPRPATDPDRRLRVGLLSATLRTHPVGWLTVAAFEALDSSQFELVCFGQTQSDDAVERRFRAASSDWHVVSRRSAHDIADAVRAENIDILIDLGGWGDQGMLNVCAQRAAPVQIKWVGMQSHSTGVAEIDWFVTDRWETPAGTDELYTERLLRLPDGYVCYSPPWYAPDVSPSPSAQRPEVTFGCFNNLAKITQQTVETWAAILRRVAASRLLLKCHQFSDPLVAADIVKAFAGLGIDPARLELQGSSTHRAQLALHAHVDIMLDPIPYSGGLTTCESLWMGVPVITLPAQTFASRHSTSHLCNIGLADWVATGLQHYEDLAVQRAADCTSLVELRTQLRKRMRVSPLCDARRFGRNLGEALRFAWRDACAQ